VRTEFSNKVKRDALQRANGKCEVPGCGASLSLNKYHYDHIIPDQMGGDASLDNCQVACFACHKEKTRKDVADIAKAKRIERRHLGIRRESRMPGARGSRLKKKMDGTVVER
jgi:5-methylcytosine-specific restriction protein A